MDNSKYRYSPLPGPRHIRLLKLQPRADPEEPQLPVELVTVSLDEAPSFEALSYAWGDPLPQAEIRCCGLTATIGLSLHGALRQLRPYAPEPDRLIWADALCINQEDTAERSSQVRMMGDIYAKATTTIIWLGEEDDDVTRAMVSFDQLYQACIVNYPETLTGSWENFKDTYDGDKSSATKFVLEVAFGDEPAQLKAFENIRMLLCRPWFTRKWVIQEVVKSKEHGVVLVAGSKSLAWIAMEPLFALLGASPSALRNFHACFLWGFETSPVRVALMHYRSATLRVATNRDTPLMVLLVRTLAFICTDPRDQITALLGIASDSSNYEDLIDYNCPSEVFTRRLACACVKDPRDLALLWSLISVLLVGRRHANSWMQNIEELPSMGLLASQASAVHNWKYVNACTSTRLDVVIRGSQLQIKGRVVDHLEELGMDMSAIIEMVEVRENTGVGLGDYQLPSKTIDRWLDECQTISENANKDEDSYVAAFLDKDVLDRSVPEVAGADVKDFLTYRRSVKTLASAVDGTSFVEAGATGPGLGVFSPVAGIVSTMLVRRFSRTLRGKIGWAPRAAETGDLICVFDGMARPYVVRPKRECEGVYSLVGECFIPGLVDGKDTGDFQSATIKLE